MRRMQPVIHKGVTYASADSTEILDCLFCRITRKDPHEPATIVLENDVFVAFKNIYPVSSHHLLISPKVHIQNVKALTPADTTMIGDMLEFAKIALAEDGATGHYCFHIPPMNSIDHLHLHAIGKPEEMSYVSQLKYSTYGPWCCTPEQLITSLRAKLS